MNRVDSHRETFIDIARGIGIMLVVLSHSGSETGLMTYVGGAFIPVFFIISGYLYHGGSLNICRLAKKMLIPYIGYSLFFILLYKGFKMNDILGVFYSRYCLYPFDIENNIFFLSSGNAPLWFLTAFFLSRLLFNCIIRFDSHRYKVLCVICLCWGGTFLMQFFPILLPWSIDTVPLFALYMYWGYYCKCKSVLYSPQWIWIILFIIYFVVCYFNGEPNLSVRIYGRSILLMCVSGLTGSLLIMKFSERINGSYIGNFLSVVGKHSMTIFCIQMFLLRMQNKIFFDVFHLPSTGLYLHGVNIVKILLTCIMGIIISKGLDKCKNILVKQSSTIA